MAEARGGRRDRAAGLLLPAKLLRPTLAQVVARPRLFRLLGPKSGAPVTWVHAPAGAGKTFLLASFLDAQAAPALWYEVDASDRDVSSLFHHIRLAAEHLLARPLDLPSLQPGVGLEGFVRRFFSRLFGHLPAGTTVVFDNCHEAASEPTWNVVFRELVGARPPHVRICVGSREAPPAALSRFRAAGTMAVVGFDRLKFDKSEVARLVRGRGGRPADSAALLRSTDGWAVALSLLTSALVEGAGPKKVRLIGPRSRRGVAQIFDFMAAEILERLDEESRTFLLEVALLPRFDGRLASALTGRANAAALLDPIEREQLLIDRHEDGQYRLHDLFRAFLLEYGERHQARADRRRLKATAARLLAERGYLDVACALLGENEQWDDAVRLIEANAPELARQGRMATLAAVIGGVPPAAREGHPWLLLWLAAASLGRSPDALTLAKQAFHHFKTASDVAGELLAWALVVQSLVMAGNDFHELKRWMVVQRRVEPGALPPELATRVAFAELMAYAYYGLGESQAEVIEARIGNALAVVEQHGNVSEKSLAFAMVALLSFFAGNLTRAEQLLAGAKGMLLRIPDEPLHRIIVSHATLLISFMAGGRFRSGEPLVREALALGEKEGILGFHSSILTLSASAMLNVGDLAAAGKILARIKNSHPLPTRLGRAERSYLLAWEALERDDFAAFRIALAETRREGEELGFAYGLYQVAFGRLIGASLAGDEPEVSRAIADVEDRLNAAPWMRLRAEGALSLAFAKLRRAELPLTELSTAMAQARAASVMAWGFAGPRVMRPLVTTALRHGIEVEYAKKLLEAYELAPDDDALLIPAWPWPLRVRVLGTVEIEAEGRRISFGRKLPTVPLGLLKLLAAGRPVSASKVGKALWPGLTKDARQGVLHTAVYRLRKLLGRDDAVRSSAGGLSLDPSLCWTDVRAFEAACARIDRLAAPDERSDSALAASLASALDDLYRGPLASHGDPDALLRAAAELERRHADARAQLEDMQLGSAKTAAGRR